MEEHPIAGIDSLLRIEMEAALWDYCVGGSRLWPLIRTNVYSIAIRSRNNYCQAHAKANQMNIFKPGFVANELETAKFFASNRNLYDALFFTRSRYQRLNADTGKYRDQFYHPYLSLFSNPLIFETSYRWTVPQPRELEDNTFLSDHLAIAATAKSTFHGLRRRDDITISSFMKNVCSLFSIPEHYQGLYSKLRSRVKNERYFVDYVDKIVSRLNHRIAFVHCASYLGDEAVITRRLKENGVVTIELQHGFVGQEHFSYNYPTGVTGSTAKEYLPDYYLTFGEYWGEQIRTPSTVVPVGNPSLNAAKDTYEKNFTPVRNSILIVSQGTVTLTMVKIARFLSRAFPRHSIFFKLHPGEVPFAERYEELEGYDNIQIKKYDDIYELIASSEIIIGYNSTTLFEAVAFPGKRIFILNNVVIPDSLGYKFASCEELRDAILDDETGYPHTDSSYFWETDWGTNVSVFLGAITP
jgi:hypothetical protein